tara:strand:- start:1056 stop:1442 length:387 start_codon:yes stop_codon:yes gene_type:complete
MINKKITLIISNNIYKNNSELFINFKSHEYDDFYIDEFGLKQTMDYWPGDDFFGNYMEIFYFFGIDDEEDCSKCKGLKIWFKEYSKFDEKDKETWTKIAKDSGFSKQIKIKTSFGKVKDFEYDDLKDY